MKPWTDHPMEVLEISVQDKQARWDFPRPIPRLTGLGNLILLSLLVGSLVGCASAARLDKMAVTNISQQKFSDRSPFTKAIFLQGVSGGKETNPLWQSNVNNSEFEGALKVSMQAHGLLAVDENRGRYLLNAKLVNLDKPFVGFDMKVTSTIRYTLTLKGRNNPMLDDSITASYTATVNDAFLGAERLRLANEGSIRENIRQFLKKLASYGER